MRYCNSCKVTVTGDKKRCPLCRNLLSGTAKPDTDVFPTLPPPRYSRHLLYKLVTLTAISAIVICFAVNWMVPSQGWWAVFASVGILAAWLTTMVGIAKRRNIIKNITWQMFLLSGLLVLLDFTYRWRGWSVDFVLPCLCLASMASVLTISLAMHIPPREYLINLLLMAVYGLVPLILLLTDVVRIIYPSVICVACSVILVAGSLIFEGRNVRREARKKFHLR